MPRRLLRTRLETLLALVMLFAVGCGGDGGGGGGGGPGPNNPPTVIVTGPTSDTYVIRGDTVPVSFQANDDGNATVRVIADADANFLTTGDQTVLFQGIDANGIPQTLDVATTPLPAAPNAYTVFVAISDGVNPEVVGVAPGRIIVYVGLAVSAPPTRSATYGVVGPYAIVAVGEQENGGVLLNGDADTGDAVVAVIDASNGTVTQSAVDADPSPVDIAGTARILRSTGSGLAWQRREQDAGVDLNGDLDQADILAAYVAPPVSLTPVTVLRAGATVPADVRLPGAPSVDRPIVAYLETPQLPLGNANLNPPDADALDTVFAAIDYLSGNIVVAPFAAVPGTRMRLVGNATGGFYQSEAAQGIDWNVDGDQLDTTLVLVDPSTAPPLMAIWDFFGRMVAPAQPPRAVDGTAAFGVSEAGGSHRAVAYVSEAADGIVSLNGDADVTDFVPAIYDATAKVETLMVAPGLAANAGAGATFAAYDDHRAFFLVMEEGIDRNGDGDTVDTKVLLYTDDTLVPPAPLPIPGLPGRGTIVLDGGSAAHIATGWIAVVANEFANGLDLNGDADQGDNVLLLIQTAGGPAPLVHNTQLVTSAAGTIPVTGISDGITGVLVRAIETANGGDLNGDADNSDTLFFYFNFNAPTARVALAGTGGDHAWVAGGIIGVTANEALTGVDLNLDGDTNDFLFRSFGTNGTVLEPGILSASHSVPYSADGALWAFLRSEIAENRNLNGDADTLDFVLGLWRP